MAKIKITYTAAESAEARKVWPIAAEFEPTGYYVDLDAYDNAPRHDENVPGNGEWEGLAAYIATISTHPGIVLMFKNAMLDGEIEFEETEATMVEYYRDLARVLANEGFKVAIDGKVIEAPSVGEAPAEDKVSE